MCLRVIFIHILCLAIEEEQKCLLLLPISLFLFAKASSRLVVNEISHNSCCFLVVNNIGKFPERTLFMNHVHQLEGFVSFKNLSNKEDKIQVHSPPFSSQNGKATS